MASSAAILHSYVLVQDPASAAQSYILCRCYLVEPARLVQEGLQEAEWLCSTCQGNDQNPISTSTPAGKLLSGSPMLGLCKIETIWRMPGEPEEESYFSGQWYLLPEETKQGRKVWACNV